MKHIQEALEASLENARHSLRAAEASWMRADEERTRAEATIDRSYEAINELVKALRDLSVQG